MRPCPFEYHRAESVDHALDLLAQHGDDARLLAGGQSLVPMMNLRLARPEVLIDIDRLGLDDVRVEESRITVGALARHAAVLGNAFTTALAPGEMIVGLQFVFPQGAWVGSHIRAT